MSITYNDLIEFYFTTEKIYCSSACLIEVCDLKWIIALDYGIVKLLEIGYELVFIEDELSFYLIKDNQVINLKRGNFHSQNTSINYLYIPTQWRLVNRSITKSYKVDYLPVFI
jgi:hypothetical protein